jgi:hypothetical protein
MRVLGAKEYLRSLSSRHRSGGNTQLKQTQRLLSGRSKSTIKSNGMVGDLSSLKGIGKNNDSNHKQAVYSAIQSSAKSLQLHGEKLLSEEKGSLFSGAETTGQTKEVITQVKAFVKEYNNMVKNMKKTEDTVNTYFAKELHSYIKEQEPKLKEMGITLQADGTLQMKESVLDKAELSSLKDVFHGKNSFVKNVMEKSLFIEKKASTDIANLASFAYKSTYQSTI